MTQQKPEPLLASRLPHRPPALYVERVVARTAESLICSGRLPASDTTDEARRSTSGLMAIELAAQASALWEADRDADSSPPRTALLVSIRNCELAEAVPCDEELRVTLHSLGGAGGLRKFRCIVTTRDDPERTLARGEFSTFSR